MDAYENFCKTFNTMREAFMAMGLEFTSHPLRFQAAKAAFKLQKENHLREVEYLLDTFVRPYGSVNEALLDGFKSELTLQLTYAVLEDVKKSLQFNETDKMFESEHLTLKEKVKLQLNALDNLDIEDPRLKHILQEAEEFEISIDELFHETMEDFEDNLEDRTIHFFK